MRPALAAAIICCAALSPVVAQDAVTPSADAELAIRCGAAFGVMRSRLSAAGDDAGALSYATKASLALEKAAAELIPAGMTVEAFGVLAETYAAELTAPFRETTLSEADCDAVVE